MPRQGEKIVTTADLDTRLSALQNQINSILSFLVFDTDGDEIKNFMIQTGRNTVGAPTAITFPKPFKTGTSPVIAPFVETDRMLVFLTATPTATGFNARGRGDDGIQGNTTFEWIAIGERG